MTREWTSFNQYTFHDTDPCAETNGRQKLSCRRCYEFNGDPFSCSASFILESFDGGSEGVFAKNCTFDQESGKCRISTNASLCTPVTSTVVWQWHSSQWSTPEENVHPTSFLSPEEKCPVPTMRNSSCPSEEMAGSHLLWRDDQFMACFMPKVGCTSWLEYMSRMLHVQHPNIPRSSNAYNHFEDHGTQWYPGATPGATSCDDFVQAAKVSPFRFAIVRHPWDRLISLYHNKFKDVNMFPDRFGELGFDSLWAEKGMLNQELSSVIPSFHEMVMGIADAIGRDGKGRVPRTEGCGSAGPNRLRRVGCNTQMADSHVIPQTMLCQLDVIPYDMMINLDEMTEEQRRFIQTRLGFSEPFPVPESQEWKFKEEERRRNPMKEILPMKEEEEIHAFKTRVYPCSIATVAAAIKVYGRDALLMGLNFSAINRSCAERGHSNYREAWTMASSPGVPLPLPNLASPLPNLALSPPATAILVPQEPPPAALPALILGVLLSFSLGVLGYSLVSLLVRMRSWVAVANHAGAEDGSTA